VSVREWFGLSGHVFVAIFSLAMVTNVDVVLVKHFFTGEEAGLYSGALTFGRMIYFIPLGFITVMYPKMVQNRTRGSDLHPILVRSIVYIGIPVLIMTIALNLYPSFLLGHLLGNDYLGAEGLVGLYAVMMLFFSISTAIVFYFLASRIYLPIYTFAGISIAEVISIWYFHPSLESVVWILLWFNLIFLGIGSMLILTKRFNMVGGGSYQDE
jgi:O-antigen/teichoic acid export membrane protein